EAIMLYGRFRVYAKTFDAEPKAQGVLRINRPLPLLPAGKQGGMTRAGWIQAALAALKEDRPVNADPEGPAEALIGALTPAIEAVMANTAPGALVGELGDTAFGAAATTAFVGPDPAMRAPGIYYEVFQVFPRLPEYEKEGEAPRRPRYDLKGFMLQRPVIHRDDAKAAAGRPVEGASPDRQSVPMGRNLMTLIPEEEIRIQAALGGITVQSYIRSLDHLIETFREAIPASDPAVPREIVRMAGPPDAAAQDIRPADDPSTTEESGKGEQGGVTPAQEAPLGSPAANDRVPANESEPDRGASAQRRLSPGQ
ncbi:hypothetical protein, partial [Acidiphilium sp.]|uniref:hypothetical protein n=1 Tax=Acidiphilium sp. TaxID=527 RepID=UPI003D02D2CA